MRRLPPSEFDHLIEAGSTGYLPLFYQDWIHESYANLEEVKKLSFTHAAEVVEAGFKKMEKHQSIERKKTALQALNTNEREIFVRSFMKLVEYRTLDRLRELH